MKFPKWIPADLTGDEKYQLVRDEREAVKRADRQFDLQWSRMRKPFDEFRSIYCQTLAAFRQAAREDYRAGVLREIAAKAALRAELPSHIARLHEERPKDVLDLTPRSIVPALRQQQEK